MSATGESYAYLCVRAHERNARGDAVIASLPVAADQTLLRGVTRKNDGRCWKSTRAMILTPRVAPGQLEDAVTALVERLSPHTEALRAVSKYATLWLAIVPDGIVGAWHIRLWPATIAWLAAIRARAWIDTFSEAPPGTEVGPVCAFCGLVRPTTGEEPLVDLLGGSAICGATADARLIAAGLDHDAACRIFESWPYLAASLDDMDVVVLAGRPWVTTARRDGAAAVPILLRRLRAARQVWSALRSGHPTAIEIRVRHWANAARAGAWMRRRDVRRMAKLGAMFHYQIVPDRKPSFREDGTCHHCAYVQTWCHAEEARSTGDATRAPEA